MDTLWWNAIIFVVGLILLVKGSDIFVKSSASIAKLFHISEFIIGLTLVAIGTSLPELAASVTAALKNNTGLVVGNITGSNIANIGLIIGIAAAIGTIKTKEIMLKRDGLIMLFVTALFYFLTLFGDLSWWGGLILLVLYFSYVMFLIHYRSEIKKLPHFMDYMRYLVTFRYVETVYSLARGGTSERKERRRLTKEKAMDNKFKIIKDVVFIILSLTAVIVGANFLVDGAVYTAMYFHIPETVVGITMLAIGTSLPELSVCISAARKGYSEIILGNVIGSNITNVLLIGGVASLIHPLTVEVSEVLFIGPVMVIFTIVLILFTWSGWKISRKEGIIFLVSYFVFIIAALGFGYLVEYFDLSV